MNRLLGITVVAISLVDLVLPTCLHAEAAAPLRIMLTNDDGYDAPGVKAVYESLVANGHDVTLVAPLENQSSSGMRVTTQGSLDYQEESTGVWSVDGSPADAVLVGLLHIMKDEAPDIVISGANFGPNLGYAYSSGTLGAATMAMYVGLPAIAISVGVDPAEHGAKPIAFPSTFKAFQGAAEFASRLVENLHEARMDNASLLPDHTILNVNYPPADPEGISGVRVTQATWDSGVRIAYEESGQAGQLDIRLHLLETGADDSDDADWQWFARGYVTISVLDADSDAGESLRDDISRRLATIGQQ